MNVFYDGECRPRHYHRRRNHFPFSLHVIRHITTIIILYIAPFLPEKERAVKSSKTADKTIASKINTIQYPNAICHHLSTKKGVSDGILCYVNVGCRIVAVMNASSWLNAICVTRQVKASTK